MADRALSCTKRGFLEISVDRAIVSIIMGEVVPTPGAPKPFKVVFKREDGTAFGNEVPVGSMSEGEHVVGETLKGRGATRGAVENAPLKAKARS